MWHAQPTAHVPAAALRAAGGYVWGRQSYAWDFERGEGHALIPIRGSAVWTLPCVSRVEYSVSVLCVTRRMPATSVQHVTRRHVRTALLPCPPWAIGGDTAGFPVGLLVSGVWPLVG